MKREMFMFIAIGLAAATIHDAHAGILGKRYIGANIGQVTPGNDDVKDIDDSIITYGANIRLPANQNLDFVASIGQSKLDGEGILFDPFSGTFYEADVEATGTAIAGALQYQFVPGATVNPFVYAGVVWVKSEIESGGEEVFDDDDTGFQVGGGIEFNIEENVSINVGGVYQTEMFDEDDMTAVAGLNIWATEQLLLSIGGTYSFEAEDVGVSAGVSVGF